MVERRWGRVVNVSACLGRMSGPGTAGGLAPYRVSKAALNALTKNLSAELGDGRRGVLVDATCPGHCRTDMGGPDAARAAPAEGAATAVWLACRDGGPTGCCGRTGRSCPGEAAVGLRSPGAPGRIRTCASTSGG